METEKNISGISENLAESITAHAKKENTSQDQGALRGKKIAISVSESEELESLGLSENHLKDISIEIARYLIVNGGTMLYGGDLRNNGFTRIFSELSFQYKYLSDKERRFINYFPFPNSKSVDVKVKADFIKQQVEAIVLEVPQHLGKIDTDRKYDPFKSNEDRYVFSECFSDMRIKMATDSHARILVGGKQKNYLGYVPGIVEEAFHSLSAGKPIYLLGGFGGATRSIINVIEGNRTIEFTNDFQFDTEFLKEFREFCSGKSVIKLDFDYLNDFFKSNTLNVLSRNNGLSADENKILFTSTNIHELVFLIVKGLKNINV